jgi:hypothetical protein
VQAARHIFSSETFIASVDKWQDYSKVDMMSGYRMPRGVVSLERRKDPLMSSISKPASDRAGNGGANDDGLLPLRHSIAESVMARLTNEIPGLSPHFGEHYETTDEPEVIVYRSSGAAFRWLAFAFSPWRMWDLHVGIVATDRRRLCVGFHICARASSVLLEDLKRLGADIGASVQHQKVAVEYQANLPPFDVDSVSFDTLVDTVAQLCRKYAPVATRVRCPTEMRDDAR